MISSSSSASNKAPPVRRKARVLLATLSGAVPKTAVTFMHGGACKLQKNQIGDRCDYHDEEDGVQKKGVNGVRNDDYLLFIKVPLFAVSGHLNAASGSARAHCDRDEMLLIVSQHCGVRRELFLPSTKPIAGKFAAFRLIASSGRTESILLLFCAFFMVIDLNYKKCSSSAMISPRKKDDQRSYTASATLNAGVGTNRCTTESNPSIYLLEQPMRESLILSTDGQIGLALATQDSATLHSYIELSRTGSASTVATTNGNSSAFLTLS